MKKNAFVFAIAAILFLGCKNVEKKETSAEESVEKINSTIADSQQSENPTDLFGVYQGTLPCADCEGIKTVLELKDDKTFTLSQTYLGKSESEFKQNGEYQWNKDGSMIRLRSETSRFQFKVGENQLQMMDLKGNIIEGDLAEMYILKKTIQ
jgi:uncharacterized lipoprotein NlpE involved in copper resistance